MSSSRRSAPGRRGPGRSAAGIGDECNQKSITQQTGRSTRIERKGFPVNAEQSTAGWRSTAERWNEIKVEMGGKINLTGFIPAVKRMFIIITLEMIGEKDLLSGKT